MHLVLEVQQPDHEVAQAPVLELERHLVDGLGRGRGHDRIDVDVAEERDLLAQLVVDVLVAAGDDDVGLDADAAQLLDRVLRGLGLELAGGGQGRQQRDVDVEHVVAADVLAHLADGLEERQRLDVADGAADLDDDDVGGAIAGHAPDALLDLVGDVRDDLHRAAEEVAAALLGDDRLVDAPGGDVGQLAQVLVDEALVVAEVEVGLGAVVGDEDLAVLVRRHGARVDVDVRVELQDGDSETATLEQPADRCCRDALAQRRRDPAGHEDILRHGSPRLGLVFPMLPNPGERAGREPGPRSTVRRTAISISARRRSQTLLPARSSSTVTGRSGRSRRGRWRRPRA